MPEQRRAGKQHPAASGEQTDREESPTSRRTLDEASPFAGVGMGPRGSMLVTGAFVILGAALWGGAGERAVPAISIAGALILLAAISPPGASGAVVLAVPTAFEIHPLVIGSFSLLELAILSCAAGLTLRTVAGGGARIRSAIAAIVNAIEVVFPALLLLPAALLAFRMMPQDAFRAEALREIRLVIVEPLLFLLCAMVILRPHAARTYVWSCAVVGGACVGAVACFELLSGGGDVVDGAVVRATGPYSHPNNLALFIERMLLIALPYALIHRRSPYLWGCIALQGAGVILTFSRGALIAVVIGTAVALLLLGMRRELFVLGGMCVAGGLILLAIARDRVLDVGGSGSEPTRFAIWRSSLRMALDHPLFGVGPDQFLYQYRRRYVEPAAWPERYTSHPHNLALDVWLRLGVAGIAGAIGVAFGILSRCAGAFSAIRTDPIAVGGVAALAGGLAHGMFDNGFFLPDLAVLTWLAAAFVFTSESGQGLTPG